MYDPFAEKSCNDHTGRVNDFENDIGYLISESSYQTYDSPWTSPMHFYVAGGTDNGNSRANGTDQNRDHHTGNIPTVMASDAFTPTALPSTKQGKKKSSLTSLLASNISFVSASTRNDEKRRQQYGDDESVDSVATFPGMGERVLNMALVMSSGKIRKASSIAKVDSSNIEDEISSDELPVENGHQSRDLEDESIGFTASCNVCRKISHDTQSLTSSNSDVLRRLNSEYEDERGKKSLFSLNKIDANHRLNQKTTKVKDGISNDYEEKECNRKGISCASPVVMREFQRPTDLCNSTFPSSKNDSRYKSIVLPLVSAMRNKGATSTEIAVAR